MKTLVVDDETKAWVLTEVEPEEEGYLNLEEPEWERGDCN